MWGQRIRILTGAAAGNRSRTSHYVLGPASDPFADPYPGSVDSVLFIGEKIIDRLLIVSSIAKAPLFFSQSSSSSI